MARARSCRCGRLRHGAASFQAARGDVFPIAQFPVCKTDVPGLVEHKPGHFAACHFAGAPLSEVSNPEGLKARA
ncbi:MAG TPA: hypothetical protein VEO54_14905 [Thermoanaerobaculia bacterium]|nr:hypothetical protein [Thermoanaerobaculia bacterium]